jgi:hypothetical protein
LRSRKCVSLTSSRLISSAACRSSVAVIRAHTPGLIVASPYV